MKTPILIIEDDKAVQRLMAAALENEGYRHYLAGTGEEALMQAITIQPQIILLDLGLPDMDGIEVIERLRLWCETPIIVISARSAVQDKIEALDAGADDYLTKPFSVEELLARIRVAMRKMRYDISGEKNNAIFNNGQLKIDYNANCVYLANEEIHLTPIEYKLLTLLARNVGKVLTHRFILKEVWGNTLDSDMSTLRVFMTALRKKIEPNPAQPIYLQTHVGIGYRMLKAEG